MIRIDGSAGEGGGQILRTSLALSLLTGRPFRIEKIRAGRKKPGLLRQHLTAVDAAMRVGGGTLEGAEAGSTELAFTPGTLRAGEYELAVGTAGSTMLVLQTILVPLLFAKGKSVVRLEGGTHNPAAPPFDFIEKTFLPLLGRMGARVSARLERAGFYPAGGGAATFEIDGGIELAPLDLTVRGSVRSSRARAVVSNLPFAIAEREIQLIRKRTSWSDDALEAHTVPSAGPGNVVMVEIASENVTELFTAFGERGVSAEAVATHTIAEAERYLASGAAAGVHLTDQLLLPLAAGAGGRFTASGISSHTRTNAAVIETFTGAPIQFHAAGDHVEVEAVAPRYALRES
ncbi:MAG: RNA 3'-terminal phosphate cyclase [Acidobacteria bacterium]|nr:RNA 3'-terminal phosphate cyclase [Acidobacteriota bacterium]